METAKASMETEMAMRNVCSSMGLVKGSSRWSPYGMGLDGVAPPTPRGIGMEPPPLIAGFAFLSEYRSHAVIT